MKEKPILFSGEMVRAIRDGRKTQTRRVMKPQPTCYNGIEWLWKPNRKSWKAPAYHWDVDAKPPIALAKFGAPYQVGQKLWVRETWRIDGFNGCGDVFVRYRADDSTSVLVVPEEAEDWEEREWVRWTDAALAAGATTNDDDCFDFTGIDWKPPWKPSIFMPKWATRIWLEVTGKRAEQVQDIDGIDAVLEGTAYPPDTEETIDKCPNEWPTYEELLIGPFRALWDSINAKRGFGWDTNCWAWVYEFKRLEASEGASR